MCRFTKIVGHFVDHSFSSSCFWADLKRYFSSISLIPKSRFLYLICCMLNANTHYKNKVILRLLLSDLCINLDCPAFIGEKAPGLHLPQQSNSPVPSCVYPSVSVSRLTPLTLSGCQIACHKPSIKYNDKPSNTSPHELEPEMRGCDLCSLEADRCAVEKHTQTQQTVRHRACLSK